MNFPTINTNSLPPLPDTSILLVNTDAGPVKTAQLLATAQRLLSETPSLTHVRIVRQGTAFSFVCDCVRTDGFGGHTETWMIHHHQP